MIVEGIAALGAAVATAGALWLAISRRRHTGRRRCAAAEAAVRQFREEAVRLSAVLDALPVPVWWRDPTGNLTDCNNAYAAALGESREAVLAAGAALTPRRTPAHSRAEGDASSMAHVVIDGERRLLEMTEIPGRDGATIGFALDRTALESAQGALQRHLTAHAAVLESLSAAVAVFGPDQRLRFNNTAFARLWALDAAWLAAAPSVGEILDCLHEARLFPEYADFPAFKRARSVEFTALIEPRRELVHLPDGRTLQLTIAPHPFGGLVYVYDDVSDRLALECSYNTLAQVQRAAFDHLFEGIAVYGGDGRLKLHNPAFLALWGLSQADVAGEPHIGAIADKIRPFLEDGADWRKIREEVVAQVTAPGYASGPLYRRDGSMLQVASVPLPDGEVMLTYLDVSDSARVERALRERNEALETAGRLKTEFVVNASHDLRTPLNTIVGFAEILHNQYFGPLNASQRDYSRAILDSAHQLTALIGDMIDLATIEAGDLELERRHVDVAAMLEAIANLLRERAHSRELELMVRCPREIGAIEGDERRLKQALFNLVSNAIKFTPPGGTVCVAAERRGGELLLEVADSAGRIAATGRSAAAGLPASGRRRAECGLGLALVKSLIGLHAGTVETHPLPEGGTRILCRLPAGRTVAEASAPEAGDSPGKAGETTGCDYGAEIRGVDSGGRERAKPQILRESADALYNN
jgi:signal transduction histidine kinase